MDEALADRIEAAIGRRPVALAPLAGGSTVAVWRVDLPGGDRLVAKWGGGHLALERWMLDVLTRDGSLPLPTVVHGVDDLLLLDWVEGEAAPPGPAAQEHAAECLARLHATPRPRFGLERDTAIGRLIQPNPWTDRWVDFFREHRLLHMARAAHAEGTLAPHLLGRLERLAGRLDTLLCEPAHPTLLHGDVWTGNLLVRGDRIAAFLDPAISIGHPEMELAYATLFDTLGRPFFRRYAALAPLDPGWWAVRRPIYTLYPLLVHVRYWDTAYARGIEAVLDPIE
jgi:fructosamine-3-kinase